MDELKSLLKLSNGNKGTIECLERLTNKSQDLISGTNLEKRNQILNFIKANEIVGTSLYVLYNDIANKNLDLMHYIIDNASIDAIKTASSSQDYSGKNLLRNWIEGYKISNR
jgi:hypothetical protein